ncbi:MAG: aminotransferase class V-fold PLP-dependent enzyme [Clostridia bacterium]|nr:aminotransferase class V-fold PLP-dependent enzyme [Clostridia bacterium]
MIYFDNSATGGFKPRAVTDAVFSSVRYLSANPGRSGHRLSLAGAETVMRCRETIANLFGSKPERVIFTKNCTEALNLAIFGYVKKGFHVITTVYEHNSVLRPLFYLKEQGVIELSVVKPKNGLTLEQSIEQSIKPNTRLVVLNSVSNVTGESLPISKVSSICKQQNITLILDGAQGGGHIPLSVGKGVSMIALAGHKGLLGIMGSGVLVLDETIELSPLLYGGTGTETFNLSQPQTFPERFEAGTLNLPAISGLYEGAKLIAESLTSFANVLTNYTKSMISGLKSINGITCYSNPNPSGIVAFALNNLPSNEVADILSRDYDIAVRGGFHCAPLMHEFLKTNGDGLVRASVAVQNSTREINYFLSAVENIAKL